MSEWIPICRVRGHPPARRAPRPRARGAAVAVFRAADDHVFALLDRCPHKGGPLSQGIVFGHSVACPLHNWTSAWPTAARVRPTRLYGALRVRVADGEVSLDADELRTLALDERRPRRDHPVTPIDR